MHKSWKYAHRWSLLPNIILYCQHLTRKCCTLEKYAQISSQPHQKGQLWAHKWGGSIDLILINSVIDQYFWPFYFTFNWKASLDSGFYSIFHKITKYCVTLISISLTMGEGLFVQIYPFSVCIMCTQMTYFTCYLDFCCIKFNNNLA